MTSTARFRTMAEEDSARLVVFMWIFRTLLDFSFSVLLLCFFSRAEIHPTSYLHTIRPMLIRLILEAPSSCSVHS